MGKNEKRPSNPFAFPVSTIDGYTSGGMTLRDYFANSAEIPYNVIYDFLEKIYGSKNVTTELIATCTAEYKYILADAMLKEREKWE